MRKLTEQRGGKSQLAEANQLCAEAARLGRPLLTSFNPSPSSGAEYHRGQRFTLPGQAAITVRRLMLPATKAQAIKVASVITLPPEP